MHLFVGETSLKLVVSPIHHFQIGQEAQATLLVQTELQPNSNQLHRSPPSISSSSFVVSNPSEIWYNFGPSSSLSHTLNANSPSLNPSTRVSDFKSPFPNPKSLNPSAVADGRRPNCREKPPLVLLLTWRLPWSQSFVSLELQFQN